MKKKSDAKVTTKHRVAVENPPAGPGLLSPTTPSELSDVHRKLFDVLAPYEIEVPQAWARHATPNTVYPGRCYDRSFRFAMDLDLALGVDDPTWKDLWLVHGEYWGFQRHAWVELPGGVVFDGPYQRFYDRAGYYAAVYASPWYMYSPTAAHLISIRMPQNEDGTIRLANWHDDLRLPWANPDNPTRIGDDEVMSLLERCGLEPSPPARRRKKSSRTN